MIEDVKTKENSSLSSADAPRSTSTIPSRFQWPLFVWVRVVDSLQFSIFDISSQCIFGTSLTIADGIFTPAVSVTSAVQGIAVAKASVANDVIPISIVRNMPLIHTLVLRFGSGFVGHSISCPEPRHISTGFSVCARSVPAALTFQGKPSFVLQSLSCG